VQRHQPLQRKLTSQRDVKARSAMLELKKRHVETVTRLPTKRMATACWAFIVAKSTLRETAPMLHFCPLQSTNIEFHPQVVHNVCGSPGDSYKAGSVRAASGIKASAPDAILYVGRNNPLRHRSM
jgi:hypothetical protein